MILCAIKKYLSDRFDVEKKRLDELEKNEPITTRGQNIPFLREQSYQEGYLTALSDLDKYVDELCNKEL